MKVKLMSVLNLKEKEVELFGVKIQVTPRRAVFVAEGNAIYSTPSREIALLKLSEVQQSLDSDSEAVKFLINNPKVKVAIF